MVVTCKEAYAQNLAPSYKVFCILVLTGFPILSYDVTSTQSWAAPFVTNSFGDFWNFRHIQLPPSFQSPRDLGSCALEQVTCMMVSGAGGSNLGELQLSANRARFRGITASLGRFSRVGGRPPYEFSGISGVPEIPNYRRAPRFPAISDLASRGGSLVRGFQAPGRRIWGVATSSWPGPISGAQSSGAPVFRGG